MVGLLFKASVGPFHTWTPDVYQGAPTSVTAFMAACTKVAAFGAILRVFTVAFGSTVWEWRGVLWVVAIASMVIGAVLGLTQTDVKRMIAYSSVAHAGFLLLGAMAITPQGLSATMFYLLAYGFATVALFGLVSLVRGPDGEATHLSAGRASAKRAPVVAAAVTFLMLSLAGIPLTSGFTAKFAVFAAALGRRHGAAGHRGSGGQRGGRVLLPAARRAHVLLRAGRRRPDRQRPWPVHRRWRSHWGSW